MPRMQVYLPDGMYQQVKARGLPVSELLQKAVQAELRRLDLLAETEASARVQPLTVCFSARSERGLKPATTLRSKRTGEPVRNTGQRTDSLASRAGVKRKAAVTKETA